MNALTALTLVVLVTLCSVGSAAAANRDDEAVKLGITPVGHSGSYIELTMQPGEARQLTVELGNFGGRDAVAYTYPADAYSLVNGGIGIRLAGEPVSGATRWLGYEEETLEIPAGTGHLKTFPIVVPDDVAPGEYLTSVVIQDATPDEPGTPATGVTLNRVTRQAISILVTVPGPAAPGLSLGLAAHKVVAGTSVVSVGVANTGNVRLVPAGEFILFDAVGTEMTRYPVAMRSVYAGTATLVEIPFDTLLNAATYSITLTLTDPTHNVTATVTNLELVVEAVVATPTAVSENIPAASVDQKPQAVTDAGTTATSPVIVATAIAALLAAGCITTIYVTRRRRSRTRPAQVIVPAMTLARPTTVRQLVPPRQSTTPRAATVRNIRRLGALQDGGR